MTIAESKSQDLTYQELLDLDTHEVNPTLRLTSDEDFGTCLLYTSDAADEG